MNISATSSTRPIGLDSGNSTGAGVATAEAFQAFVGETFFGLMLKALRQTSDKVAYLDGGQAESMFRQQLDQTVAEELSASHGKQLADPLLKQFSNSRGQTRPSAPGASIDVRV